MGHGEASSEAVRLVLFSDAIFAIAATIQILPMKLNLADISMSFNDLRPLTALKQA